MSAALITAIAALVTAVGGAGVGLGAFIRNGRAEDAKERASAATVGLEYVREGLAAQQLVMTRQEGEIGELRGQLKECRTERRDMAERIQVQDEQIAVQRRQIADLQARLA